MNDSRVSEKRKLARWRTATFFSKDKRFERKFFDVISEAKRESIGHLVDLNVEGLKIIGVEAVEKGKRLNLRIDLPREVKGVQQIFIVAQCMWSEKDVNPQFYLTGFKIISISPPFAEIIETLIGQ